MTLPIYELKISEDIDNETEVSFVALVDEPAIKKDFLAFKDDTCPMATQDIATNLKDRQNAIDVAYYGPLNPNLPSDEYWTRKAKQFNATIEEAKQSLCATCAFFNVSQKMKECIANGIGNDVDPYNVIDAGDLGFCEAFDFKCASKRTCDAWVVGGPIQEFAESYNDYPKQASENAKIALRWAESNGWGECGTPVGKARANQLANNEPISRDTIARMSAFERQRQNSQRELGDGCGRLMWLAWGGDEGVEWATRKLAQIDKKNFSAKKISFAIINEEQRIISGPLMIADELIYRNNENFGEHYVKFSAETIKQIAIKFAKKKFQNNVNLMHDSNQKVEGVTMFESFIVDKKRGIMPMAEFKEVADGSWFGSFYVENEKVWQEVKKGTYKGFSVEGLFDYTPPISAEENALKTISKLLNDIIED